MDLAIAAAQVERKIIQLEEKRGRLVVERKTRERQIQQKASGIRRPVKIGRRIDDIVAEIAQIHIEREVARTELAQIELEQDRQKRKLQIEETKLFKR